MTTPNPFILIPARMGSTRLPGKPLAEIAGEAMIVQVWRRAMESLEFLDGAGRIAVACDGEGIAQVIRDAGGEAVLTDPGHPSGSDRVYEALQKLDPERKHDIVVNLQGDLPTLDPKLMREVLLPLADPAVDIATLAAVIVDEEEKTDPSAVKVVMSRSLSPPHEGVKRIENSKTVFSETRIYASESEAYMVGGGAQRYSPPTGSPSSRALVSPTPPQGGSGFYRALYFTRAAAPYGEGPLYHHIGLYAYRRPALERFVALPVGELEKREKLEQLRALENGMTIAVRIVDTVPLGVDTQEQLEQARIVLNSARHGI